MRLQIRISAAIAYALALGLLAACGNNAQTASTSDGSKGAPVDAGVKPKKKSLKITMIAKSSTNPVFLSARQGAEDAARELSAKGVPVTIDWRTPETEDGQVQANRIAQAVSEGTDAILIACSDASKVTGAINDAVDKGVPVMTFDSDAPNSKRFSFYGGDNKEIGAQVMRELAKQIGGKGNVAILAGNQNAPNLQQRVQGVQEEAKKTTGVKIVGVFYHPETPQDAAAEVSRAMKANPQIDAWAMVGGWPLFTPALLTDPEIKRVKIVAVDALPAQLEYLRRGIAPVLLAQPIYEWGHTSVLKIYEMAIEGKEIPPMVKMELIPVTRDKMADWAKQLQKWGFKDINPIYLSRDM